jgi:hypothetical protein
MSEIAYPARPQTFPAVWGDQDQETMVPQRIAVWFREKQTFQVFDVCVPHYPVLTFIPTHTDRPNAFYFAKEQGDTQSRTITVYKPRAYRNSHMELAIWFSGGWLCRTTHGICHATIPIMCISDDSKLPFRSTRGIFENQEYNDWLQTLTDSYYRSTIHNRIVYSSLYMQMIKPVVEQKPTSIPQYVADLLALNAIEKKESCSITMESIVKGEVAVSSCFHVFSKNGFQEWHKQKGSCPLCKQTCAVTYA